MSTLTRVFAGVTVWRAIAAQRYSTCLARTQMDPGAANLHALFAFAALRLFDGVDCIQMRTASGTHDRLV
jgi:hypothetical protein